LLVWYGVWLFLKTFWALERREKLTGPFFDGVF
jgi:hypothetical protein